MNFSDSGTDRDWRFIHFGLIVTERYLIVIGALWIRFSVRVSRVGHLCTFWSTCWKRIFSLTVTR